ncbi:hypothetical protein BV22DRAFT_652121 [Leucogyrophana mollusca]|uniref:Uncharacterized protein n=1 Tax=Leucogyrophana mollusca TaxID=85980 RepID=A0ACB8BC20_9AGAM|nr:hypothetical protein BV22DRAFT_652121 [Leucogyrophana mollusca]
MLLSKTSTTLSIVVLTAVAGLVSASCKHAGLPRSDQAEWVAYVHKEKNWCRFLRVVKFSFSSLTLVLSQFTSLTALEWTARSQPWAVSDFQVSFIQQHIEQSPRIVGLHCQCRRHSAAAL